MARLSQEDIRSIKAALNAKIDGTEIQTAGWMPGSNWEGTPFQPIYEKAARRDFNASELGVNVNVAARLQALAHH
jgi:hypothetical protein